MRYFGDILWPFAPEIEPHFDKIAESKTNVLKGGFDMAGRGSGRRGFGDRVGSEIQEVPPWESGVVPKGLTLEEVQGVAPKKMAGLAKSTGKTYDYLSEYFEQWCKRRDLKLKEVETVHLKVYLEEARYRPELRVYPKDAKRKPRPVSVTWLRSTIAAVKKVLKFERLDHRVQWQVLADWVTDEARLAKEAPTSADGLNWELIELVVAAALIPKQGEWDEKTTRRAAFDAALIRMMWSCLLRRSEASKVTWGHITPAVLRGHAYGVLDIPSSKTDKFGKGEVGYLHVENLALLQELAVACGRDPMKRDEKVFDICPRQIGVRVKEACKHAGKQTGNATLLRGHWSGHSPRIGASRDLITHGAGLVGTMQAGRWERVETLSRYVQGIAIGDGAMARLQMAREAGLETIPAHLRRGM